MILQGRINSVTKTLLKRRCEAMTTDRWYQKSRQCPFQAKWVTREGKFLCGVHLK